MAVLGKSVLGKTVLGTITCVLKNGKAAGPDNVVGELIKQGGENTINALKSMFEQIL